jgi:DNA-directed RNA polymerase specialized sigma subunit
LSRMKSAYWRTVRDAEIVTMIDKERMTMTAVGKFWGISKQRVQQIYIGRKRRMTNLKANLGLA